MPRVARENICVGWGPDHREVAGRLDDAREEEEELLQRPATDDVQHMQDTHTCQLT